MNADMVFQHFQKAFPAFARLPKDRLFAVLVLCSGLLASLFISMATPVSVVQSLSFVLLFFWALLLGGFWRGLSLYMTCQFASALAAVQLFVIAWFSGGVYASCLMWFSVLIVANYFIVGRVAAFFLAADGRWCSLHPSLCVRLVGGRTCVGTWFAQHLSLID